MSVAVAEVKEQMSTSSSPCSEDLRGFASDVNENKRVPLSSANHALKGYQGKNIAVKSEVKIDLNCTPRTEASSPDSRNGVLDGDEEDQVEAVAIMHDNTATATNNRDIPEREGIDDEMPMSQTDQHIHQLDRDGELNEVAGSQSMLSQELIYDMQHGGQASSNASGDGDDDDDGKNSADGLVSLHLSQETETSIGMAKRIGLLSMTQESEEDAKPAASSTIKAVVGEIETQEVPHTPKRTENRQAMLSRLSNTGAPDLASFSAKKAVIAAENRPIVDITDTPIRESEGFGSLLDAVAKITEQEVAEEGEDAMLWRRGSFLTRHHENETAANLTPPRRKRNLVPRQASLSPIRKSPRMSISTNSKRKIPMAGAAVSASSSSSTKKRNMSMPNTITTSTTKKKPKTVTVEKKKPASRKSVDDTEEAQAAAIRAAALAERIVTDPGLAKQLLLSMALVRENPRSAPDTLPGPGHVLPDGFVWARYPPLENVLKKHMAEYYQLSTEKCQSAQQQAFNNDMVVVVREVAEELQWEFARCFDDRNLRDRIRCYYKTHIQNAKKRLRTMVRNPTKRANARHLLQHLDIIEQAKVEGEKVKQNNF
ncbi:hypothetical protein IV203_037663 [Nitzschia inconspicua]|uniref:Uncharacterized protein n=1 Tax=Nitzschia inconspicua TaxID=303405 RepID=A0A9K3LPD7_9STRA|nr:hypothetical protein IV203_037663 [Nitzschia inconspicua]